MAVDSHCGNTAAGRPDHHLPRHQRKQIRGHDFVCARRSCRTSAAADAQARDTLDVGTNGTMTTRNCIVGAWKKTVDREQLKRLWFDESLTILQLSIELNCSSPCVYRIARELGLPSRRALQGRECFFPSVDPTPEEIAERAAAERAKRGPGWVMR